MSDWATGAVYPNDCEKEGPGTAGCDNGERGVGGGGSEGEPREVVSLGSARDLERALLDVWLITEGPGLRFANGSSSSKSEGGEFRGEVSEEGTEMG